VSSKPFSRVVLSNSNFALFIPSVARKLRETISNALAPTPLLSYIASLQSGLWPNGELKEPSKPRTSKEKAELKESANRKLTTFIPGE